MWHNINNHIGSHKENDIEAYISFPSITICHFALNVPCVKYFSLSHVRCWELLLPKIIIIRAQKTRWNQILIYNIRFLEILNNLQYIKTYDALSGALPLLTLTSIFRSIYLNAVFLTLTRSYFCTVRHLPRKIR